MRHDISHKSIKLTISSKFVLQILSLNIFHKHFFNISHANCSQFVSSIAMSSTLLGPPTAINQVRFSENLLRFFSISKRICRLFSKKASVLILLQKKILPRFFVEFFYKSIHNLKIKMIYRNCEHTFVIYYLLVFAWVKFTGLGAGQS